MDQNPAQTSWIGIAIGFAIFAVIITLRLRRMSRERPLKIELLWVVPAIYLLIAGLLYWRFPPQGMAWLWCAAGLAAGAALGWQRGRLMHISVDRETHAIRQKASPAAMLFLIGIIAVRYAAREAAILGGDTWHIDVMAVTDVLIAFALGLLSVQRLEMFLRARRLLGEARAA
ncbi:MAG: CcdC protein domain-containing protein [Sphingomonas sp.]